LKISKIKLIFRRKVNKETAEDFKQNNGLELFIETSAKNGYNAKNVFIEAAKTLYRDYLKYKDRASRSSSLDSNIQQYNGSIKLPRIPSMNLQTEETKAKKKCGC